MSVFAGAATHVLVRQPAPLHERYSRVGNGSSVADENIGVRSPRRLVIVAGAVGLLLLVGLFVHLGLDQSDKLASVLGAFYGTIGLITLAYAAIDRKSTTAPKSTTDREESPEVTNPRTTKRLLFGLIAALSLGLAAVVVVPVLTRQHGGGSTGQASPQSSNAPPSSAAAGSGASGLTTMNPTSSSGQQSETNHSQPTGQLRPTGVVPPVQNTTNTQIPSNVQPPAPRNPWEPPAGTPEWTLHHTDAVNFRDPPQYQTAAGYGDLTFQADTHQINWWHWTDNLDLSLAGCRNQQSDHWDAIKLDQFYAPRVYCREDPDNPNRVEYVQFTAKDMNAATQYVKVKAWTMTG